MIRGLIKKQIDKIEAKDIYEFAKKNGIALTEEEEKIIYKYIKSSLEELIFMDHNPILMKAKPYLREETMNKIEELIIFFKQKYKNYL